MYKPIFIIAKNYYETLKKNLNRAKHRKTNRHGFCDIVRLRILLGKSRITPLFLVLVTPTKQETFLIFPLAFKFLTVIQYLKQFVSFGRWTAGVLFFHLFNQGG
jgi:hypothetical protein